MTSFPIDNQSQVALLFPELKQERIAPSVLNEQTVMTPLLRVLRYVQKNLYEGWDLFDGLNSRLFKNSPLYRNEMLRLMLIQFCKRSPVNFRRMLMVSKGFNPKGGALFLMGHLNLFRHTRDEMYSNEAYLLFQRLKKNVIPREQGLGWGYNFDWQARAFFVPVGTPNLVTSVYVGRALMDYYRQFHDEKALEMAMGIAGFILGEMVKFENDRYLCFNYIPGKNAEVHNANLLGASYLAETLAYQPVQWTSAIREKILKAVRFSVSALNSDGSWPYGTMPFHRWVDNFHTAFNIECLIRIGEHLRTDEFQPILEQTAKYYLRHLFTDEGLPKYYNRRLYPVDIHVIAEAIVLLSMLRQECLIFEPGRMVTIEHALRDLIHSFQDPEKGFFYYQQTEKGFNKIPYIRWGQAWMFYALSTCLRN